MEPLNYVYKKFKIFLADYFVRRLEGKLTNDDFKEEKYEYIRPRLEQLLPNLSLPEAHRIQAYFADCLTFHLSRALGEPIIPTKIPVSRTESQIPDTVDTNSSLQSKRPRQDGEQTVTPISDEILSAPVDPAYKRKTVPLMQSTPIETSELPAFSASQEETPIESVDHIQKKTMQSIPLGFRITDLPYEQQRLEREEENEFFVDILNSINVSPIHQQPPKSTQNISSSSITKDQLSSVPFLKNFARDMEKKKQNQTQDTNTTRTDSLRRKTPKPAIRHSKKRMKKIDFDQLCCLPRKQRTVEQTEQAEKLFLYFPLMPGKRRNMIQQIMNNKLIPEGQKGHIPIERIINLTNVIRAQASERLSSIEIPVQSSQLQSPSTPQALLRNSQLQPFTPIRGNLSRQSLRIDFDEPSNLQLHSLLRQQPLLTIPERASSINIHEEIPVDIPQPLDNLLQDEANNLPSALLEIPEEQQVQQNQGELSLEPLNDIPQLPENVSPIPEDPGAENALSSNLPRDISENIPIENPVIQVDSDQIQITSREILDNIAMVEPQSISSTAQLENPVNQMGLPAEDVPLSWFEILRPRTDIQYPNESHSVKRRKRKRKRRMEEDVEEVIPLSRSHDLPEVPRSPQNTITENLADFPNVIRDQVSQLIVSNQEIQEAQPSQIELPTIPIPENFPIMPDEFSNQVTQLPDQNISNDTDSEFIEFLNLIKEAGSYSDYEKWKHFDSYMFDKDEDFEMFSYIFKRIIEEDFIPMDTLFKEGTSRLEAAKGFKIILELKTMGLLEIESIQTRITGFKLKTG